MLTFIKNQFKQTYYILDQTMTYSIQQTIYMGGGDVILIFKYFINFKNVWLIIKYCNDVPTILARSTLLYIKSSLLEDYKRA